MMNVIFKLEVLKSILKLHFQRKAFERNPKKHQQKMWRKFQSTVLTISPFYQSYLKKELADFPVLEKKEFIGNFEFHIKSDLFFVAIKSQSLIICLSLDLINAGEVMPCNL